MSNIVENPKFIVEFEIDGNKVKLSPEIVKSYITNGQPLSNAEYKFFVELCKVQKLNPFTKEVHCIKYGNTPAQIVVDKSVFLKRANAHPNYKGKKNGVIVIDEQGETQYRKGHFKLPNDHLVGGWCEVFRNDRDHSEYVAVTFDEVVKKKSNGEVNSQWATQPTMMTEKVAVVRALRTAFPEDFQGMYEIDELDPTEPQNEPIMQDDPIAQNEPIEGEIIEADFNTL